MKGLFKTIWVAAVAFVIMTATNCSSDTDYFGLDELEDVQCLYSLNTYQDSNHLDMQESYFKNFTDEDWKIYIEAESRLSYIVSEDGQRSIVQKSGGQVNISDRLFDNIKSNIENTNKLISCNNEASIARIKTLNIEPELEGNDCVGLCIADYLNLDIVSVNKKIALEYPEYATGGGVLLANLLDVVRIFKPSAAEQSKFYPEDNFSGTQSISGILALHEHAVVISKIAYRDSTDNYYIWAYDPQNRLNFGSEIYKNEIPASREGGSTVIYKYVK